MQSLRSPAGTESVPEIRISPAGSARGVATMGERQICVVLCCIDVGKDVVPSV
jgi:hypothetical protein